MSRNNKSGKQMRDEARAYGDHMPDETARGRMVNDDGSPTDETAWQAQETHHQTALKSKPKAPPVSTANKSKKGNQPRI